MVAAYKTTYASILAVTADVADVAAASRRCVRRSWRCAAAKKDHRQEKDAFHGDPSRPVQAQGQPSVASIRPKRQKRSRPHGMPFLAALKLLYSPPAQVHRRTHMRPMQHSHVLERVKSRVRRTRPGYPILLEGRKWQVDRCTVHLFLRTTQMERRLSCATLSGRQPRPYRKAAR